MTALDRNRKVLGVGDEVTVHFRVTGFEAKSDGEVVNVILQTVHNRLGGNVRGTADELQASDDEAKPLVFDTEPFRVIMQRKAKPEPPSGAT